MNKFTIGSIVGWITNLDNSILMLLEHTIVVKENNLAVHKRERKQNEKI